MSKMSMLWAAIYFGGLVGFVLHPIYPLIAYLVFYYLPPHLNWWGQDLLDLRYSLMASAFLAVSILALQSGLEKLKDERNPALPWLMAWGANTVLVTTWAFDTARSWMYSVVCLKLVLLYVLITPVIRTPALFDTFGAIHVVGAAYWGYKAWDNPRREAGRLREVGGPDTQNDNQAAGHLVTVIPFAALYVLTEKRKIRRALYALSGAFVVNVFILCNSRGATLGLIAAGLTAILLAGKGKRTKLIGVGILGAATVLYLADPQFIERQQTTANPTDNSAQSRKAMFAAGIKMIKDYPLGGGGRTFHILSPYYMPELAADSGSAERSPHNTLIQLTTDWGIHGAVLYFLFMVMTIRSLRRVRKRMPDNRWYYYRALTIEAALIGTLVASMFSSRLYGESIYWMCALAFALHRLQSTELEGLAMETAPVAAAAPLRGMGEPAIVRRRANA